MADLLARELRRLIDQVDEEEKSRKSSIAGMTICPARERISLMSPV